MGKNKVLSFEDTKENEGYIVDKDGNRYYLKQKEAIQHGYIETNVPATSYNQYTITFPKPFQKIPTVIATPLGNYNTICQLNTVTEKDCKINVRSLDGIARTGRWFNWLAIG